MEKAFHEQGKIPIEKRFHVLNCPLDSMDINIILLVQDHHNSKFKILIYEKKKKILQD